MDKAEEFAVKVARVRAFMETRSYAAVVLSTQANFAWLTCGGDHRVVTASEVGASALVVTEAGVHVLTNNIEAPRLQAEELGGLPVTVHEQAWYEEDRLRRVEELAGGGRVASDTAWPDGAVLESSALARLRWQLLEPEVERYRWLGRRTAEALAAAAWEIAPGQSEQEIAARLAARLWAQGITPAVLLVAADERCYRFRHPLPTDKPLRELVMMVVGARRWGLGVAATRLVHFGPLPADLRRRHQAVCAVDACLIAETVPGAAVKDIFARAVEKYAEVGYPEQWRLHHQGGATGYAPREYRANFSCPESVLEHQAFAWNPSIAGTKSEDTILATAAGPEILSVGGDWPQLEVEYAGRPWLRPDILVR
jgi:Xaa-Pro dipeptidase